MSATLRRGPRGMWPRTVMFSLPGFRAVHGVSWAPVPEAATAVAARRPIRTRAPRRATVAGAVVAASARVTP